MHAFMGRLAEGLGDEAAGMRLLYDGSVKPDNVGEVLALDEVDGVLLSGTCLETLALFGIIEARRRGQMGARW